MTSVRGGKGKGERGKGKGCYKSAEKVHIPPLSKMDPSSKMHWIVFCIVAVGVATVQW